MANRTVSNYSALRSWAEDTAGSAIYNNTNIFDFGESLGMNVGNISIDRTETTESKSVNKMGVLGATALNTFGGQALLAGQLWQSSREGNTTVSQAYNQESLKSYYEAFTTVEKTRKAQLQAFGKEQATLAGQTFSTPASTISNTSQSILGQ